MNCDLPRPNVARSISQQEFTGPLCRCQDHKSTILVIGKESTRAYWTQLQETAAICSGNRVTCHFAIDGRDLNHSLAMQTVRDISDAGHIIMIEPASDLSPQFLPADMFLSAVLQSSKTISRTIGKTPTLVRVPDLAVTSKQMQLLRENKFIPVVASNESTSILFRGVSIVLPALARQSIERAFDLCQNLVSAQDCFQLPP